MAKRKNLTKKVRFEVFKRDSFKCVYCGSEAPDVVLEVDHILPVIEGGTNDMHNLVTSCFDCDRGKGKRKINDETELKKSNVELRKMKNRKEQLEFMIKWKKELYSIEDDECNFINSILNKRTGFSFNDKGKENIKKYIKKYGLKETGDVLEICINKYFQ